MRTIYYEGHAERTDGFLGIRKQQWREIRTAGVVSMNIRRACDDHIPGVVGRTTCSSRLCSGLLTISLPAFSSPLSVLVP
jgi:hypothetical protein